MDTINTKLLYQCKGLTANVSDIQRANAAGATAASAVVAADPTLTAAQAFSLSSRPSSPRKIFLDFDGHTTTGTNWNSLAGRDPIITPAYDKDNSPSTWSADELADIVAIWRSVAEDYAMFDVDVTTVDPGNAALTNSGIRVAIGGAYTDWYNNAAGGVAYVGSFGLPNTPCFIFTQNLGPNYAKFVWEAVSHEVGHTLGLYHDGVTGGSSYYSGDANGGWAPIMVRAWAALLALLLLPAACCTACVQRLLSGWPGHCCVLVLAQSSQPDAPSPARPLARCTPLPHPQLLRSRRALATTRR